MTAEPVLSELLAARIATARRVGAETVPRRADPAVPVPLSPVQRRLWFLWQLDPHRPAYHLPLVLRLRGPVEEPALRGAIGDLIERHEVLRSVVVEGPDGEPGAQPRPATAVPVEVRRLASDGDLAELLDTHARAPFALADRPPCRVLLVRIAEDDYAVALTLHHIATDGRSQDLLVRELAALYAARLGTRAQPPVPPQHGDLVVWREQHRDPATEQTQLQWWVEQLSGLAPVLELPGDRPRPAQPDWSSALLPVHLPAGLADRVRQTAAATGTTVFMVLMAGLQALLSRLAGTDDVAVGMPEAGRHHPGSEDVVGCFLNTLVVRGDLAGDPTGRELLQRVRQQVLGALGHLDVPFQEIVARLRPEPDLSTTPIYQVQLNVYDEPAPPRFPGLHAELSYTPVGAAKCDLAFEFSDAGAGGGADAGGGLHGSLEYRTELFSEATARRFRDWYFQLLAGIVDNLDQPVGAVGLAPVAGPLLRGPDRPRPERQTLVSRFRQWVSQTPDATAVVGPAGEATYAELAERADRIAARLIDAGARPDHPVAVLLDPGVELAAAIFGVLTAGAGYLPIDPSYPPRRIARLLTTAGVDLAVTDTTLAGQLPPAVRTVHTDRDHQAVAAGTLPGPDGPDRLAHVIFTSGSTGEPKPVAVTHRGILNCVTGMLEHTPRLAGAGFAVVSTIAADLGLASFYGALLSGGTLHLPTRETVTDPVAYAGWLASNQVDVIKCVPSHLSMLAAHGDLAAVLPREVLILGGEPVPWELVNRIRAIRPDLTIHTHYGPTESAMFSLVCDVDEVPSVAGSGSVPLGRVLANIGCYVLDRAGRPLPAGVPGELALIGPGVSRGYLNRPELTAQRFVPDPGGGAGRCYRTGDLVRVDPDSGAVEFLGRRDDQVQVRGYRVELGEVVAACRALDGVTDACVLPVGEGHERQLAGWLAAPTGLDLPRARQRLRESLPDYLVPAWLTVLDQLPLTPNGKVDRAALPPPEPVAAAARELIAPRTDTEAVVARIWCEVLELPAVSVDDDFFALGGHSFAATRVAGRLRRELGGEVPLRLLFEKPTLAPLAAALAGMAGAGPASNGTAGAAGERTAGAAGERTLDGAAAAGGIPRRDPASPAPLSSVQARLWFLSQLEPDSTAYHIPLLLGLRGRLDRAALVGAVQDLVTRHEVLRSIVSERDGELTMVTLPPESVQTSEVVTSAEELAAAAATAAGRPFRLDQQPPIRVVLFTIAEQEHALGITLHHIAADAWSVDLVVAELASAYAARCAGPAAGGPTGETAPAIQYPDYAAWLREQDSSAAVEWWVRHLAGAPPVLDLPTDQPRPPVATTAAGTVAVQVDGALAARLRAVAAEIGGTPFMVLLAAWQAFLGRLASTEDVVVGVPESGRHHPDTEPLVGCFVNTLALRTDLSGDPTGRQLLARVRETVLTGFGAAAAPFEQVVERLAPQRDPSTTPIFQVLLNVLDDQRPLPRFRGLSARLLRRPDPGSKYDLTLTLIATADEAAGDRATDRTAGGYQGTLTYRRDLFDPATAERWVDWFQTMLSALLADLDRPVGGLPLATVDGPLLAGPPLPERPVEPLVRLIERRAERDPDALAVIAPEGRFNYRELDQRANRIAHALRAAGVRRQQPVGVLLEPSRDLVAALLGIHKAGACYLPFDVSFPPARIDSLCRDAGATVVLSTAEFADRTGGRALMLDDPHTLVGRPDQCPEITVELDDLAHIVFTSGSTGTPKGVAVRHRGLSHYLDGASARFGPELVGGSYAIASTPAADLGLTAVFAPLTTGGAVHVLAREVATDPAALASYLVDHPVDVFKLVPSHLELLASHGDLAAVLPRRLLILTGEPLTWDLVARVRAARPGLRIQNHYGHTETTLSSLICEVDEVPPAQRRRVVPLGRPLPGVRGYLVDRAGNPVPAGMPGELWLAGPGLARGYVGDDVLTAQRFRADPVDGVTRCYRSGDLLRINPDSTVEYLGRADDQVKVRGHRVELGEVVAALRSLPQVADAAVLPVGEAHQRTLAAWVVPRPGDSADPELVRAALRQRLPEHQVPAAVVSLPRLPLNPNGKLDRAALPAPPVGSTAEYTAPQSPTQQRIAAVWQELLGVERVGADDDFFALGGDSFAAVRAVRELDPGLRVIDLFTHPRLRDLAGYLDSRADAGPEAGGGGLLHRFAGPAGEASMTLVCVPYGGGSAAAFRPLAEQLTGRDPAAALLAVELPGHDPARPEEPLLPIPELVDRIAAELAAIPAAQTGPIVTYGHCVGTAAAIALARRLEADGREVAGVVLAGGFPSARLPGRVPAFFNRVFGTDRWASQRTARDALRAMGGLLDDMDEAATATMLNGMRHDSRQARAWFTQELVDPGPRLRAPVLCLVGDKDQVTEFYQERYLEWGAFAERVTLAALPRAGHYFLKYQADEVAGLVHEAVGQWREGELPPVVAPDEVPVTGVRARAALRSFYVLATGQLVALVGWALSNFALGYWAFEESGRVSDYGLVVMLALVPTALLAPLGGAVADRFDRRTVMVVSYLVSALVMLVLVGLLATDSLSLWNVSVLVGVTSALTAFHQPAFLAAIAQLVPKPYLAQANAVAQLGFSVSQLVAPVAGGALIVLLGLLPVVMINVLAFAVGILTLLAIRLPNRMFRRLDEPFRRALVGGWRFVLRRRPLLLMLGFFMVVNFFTAIMWVSLAPMVLPTAGAGALGVVTSVGWIGAVLGAVAVVPWGGTRRRAIGMLTFTMVSGVGMVMMGIVPVLAVTAIGFAIRLASMTMINVHWLALIQVKVGHELQGRVLSTNLMVVLIMQPLGFMLAGPLVDNVFDPLVSEGGALAGTVGQVVGVGPGRGMALMLVCAGILLTGWGLLGLLYRPLRLLEDALPDAVPGAEIADDLDAVQSEADHQLSTVGDGSSDSAPNAGDRSVSQIASGS